MTDYFALLAQPRSSWLDPDELKHAFHSKSRELHPDVADASDAAFAQLNEAYQVLQDPKRRIQHLLALENRPPARDTSVPGDIAELFPIVAEVTQRAEALAQKLETATTPLSRSLLKPQLLGLQQRIGETLRRLSGLREAAELTLRQLSGREVKAESEWSQLHELYLRFSYLGRWIAQLEEQRVRFE